MCKDIEIKIIENKIYNIKSKYQIPLELPIKWNFRDLKNIYNKNSQQKLFDLLIKKSDEIRYDLVGCFSSTNIKILTGISPAFGKHNRKNSIEYSFEFILQRLGLLINKLKNNEKELVTIIMDWPESNDRIFYQLFSDAYYRKKQNYFCGKLRDLNFNVNLCVSTMMQSPHLQLADICVGITKDLIKWCSTNKGSQKIIKFFRQVRPFYYKGSQNQIFGYGIAMSNKENCRQYEEKLKDVFDKNNALNHSL